ncbi:MAG: ATP-binding protein [Verrucomicrobia bacterium]|nr:ATP-binding protein [Verrucomicrobiota bacterium]
MATKASQKPSKGATVLEFDTEAIKRTEAAVARETDDEIYQRLGERFEILDQMTKAVKDGQIRAMIVSGPPGVGKSFGVEKVLLKSELFNILAEKKPKFEVVKGAMSSIGLYAKLYEFSAEGNVVVFDDCDSILMEDLSLNILKGALDSGSRRFISWNTDSRILRSEGIPDRFEFKGAAIFITNIKFEHVRSKKLRDHLDALESRCHYIDLQMDTSREKILRIKQVVKQGQMLERYEFQPCVEDELIEFVEQNQDRLRELSLRMVLKIADLRKGFPNNWTAMVKTTCMKR